MKGNFILPLVLCAILCALGSCDNPQRIISADKINQPDVSSIKPTLKVYIENSGSMYGYMCDGSQLKDAIFDYVSDLNGCTKTSKLYYINSDVIPFKGSLEHYIKSLSPSTFKKAGGNYLNTDISELIHKIISNTNDTIVSMFVSDCILDLPAADSKKFLNTCRISIKNAINEGRKRIPDLGVEVLKMTSDFEGNYYYPNGAVEKIQGKRPYYIWIFGSRKVLANLNKHVPFDGLTKYGFEGIIAFTGKVDVPYEVTSTSKTSQILNPRNGNYIAVIRADFGATLQPDVAIQDPSNYSVSNSSIKVDAVRPIKGNDGCTHGIEVIIPKGVQIVQGKLTFNMPKIPDWVNKSNDETGVNVKGNMTKTTGIGHLIQGIADAYKNDDVSTDFSFTLKRK